MTLVVGRLVLDKSGWIRFSSWPLLAGNKFFLKKKRKKKYLPTFVAASSEGQWWCVDSWVADENVKTMSCSDDGWLDLTQQLPYHSPAASFLETPKNFCSFLLTFCPDCCVFPFSAPSGTPEFLFSFFNSYRLHWLVDFPLSPWCIFHLDSRVLSLFSSFQKESRILQIISQVKRFPRLSCLKWAYLTLSIKLKIKWRPDRLNPRHNNSN